MRYGIRHGIRPLAIKLTGTLSTLGILACLTFFLLRLAPGGPFDTEQAWPPEIRANIAHHYGLDQPIAVQFFQWLKGTLQGDLGESFQYLAHSVIEIIATSFPTSALLGVGALAFAMSVGLLMGCMSAWKQNTHLDRILTLISISGVSLPSYLVASLLILIFSVQLRLLPPALWEGPSSWILPMISLGWRPMALIARLTRTSMVENLTQDYIRTAYGKGLGPLSVIFKHALKNSLIPVTSLLGPIIANLITGSFVIELVFQIPGMGKHFVQAVLNRDYPLVMGVTLIYGVTLIFCDLGVDLLIAWLDPRMNSAASRRSAQ